MTAATVTRPTDAPDPLSVGARRRLLCELADLYSSEQSYGGDRPITDSLPTLLHPLRAWSVPLDEAVGLFDRFARQKAVAGKADASYDEIAAAEQRAERLLDELVGEVPA